MKEKKVRVKVELDVNEFDAKEFSTIEEVKDKIRQKYEIDEVQLYYKEKALNNSFLYEELLKKENLDIKAVIKKHIQTLKKTKQQNDMVINQLGYEVQENTRKSEKIEEKIETGKDSCDISLPELIKKDIFEESVCKEEDCEDEALLKKEESKERKHQVLSEVLHKEVINADGLWKENFQIVKEEQVTNSKETEEKTLKNNNTKEIFLKLIGNLTPNSTLIKPQAKEPCFFLEKDKQSFSDNKNDGNTLKLAKNKTINSIKKPMENRKMVKIRVLNTNVECLVDKKLLIVVNGKMYYLKKKKKEAKLEMNNSFMINIISRLYFISSYLLIIGILSFFINTQFFFVTLLTVLVLYALAKIKMQIVFEKDKKVINFLKQIICFFASLFFNPGHNMHVYVNE